MSDLRSSMSTDQGNVEFVRLPENSNGNATIVKRSSSLGALALALATAQLEFETVKKDTKNPFYNSRYADLAGIISATQKSLAKNGLVVIQSPIVDVEAQEAGVESLMVHSSGEWISNTLILPAIMMGKDGKVRFDAQSCGSAQTYARRYSYQALIGVAAEPDDDANKTVGIGTQEAADAVASDKLRKAAAKKGDDAVALTEWKEGFIALSGGGLSVLKAEIEPEVLKEMGFKLDGNVVTIPAAKSFEFEDLCKRANVPMHRFESAKKQA